ncbi:hypothetical protein L195_g018447 [Trifolium pratense]|uniref:Uncharacterized protein n=1 Tax=Trifolium pratense TaxID=57577 RepID=A0A2K3MWS4_TRIPR|nr:hypothetical protein L195_g018447 [Trifolium pratense]
MNFLKLFLVALAPVMNTLIIAVIGAILALDNIGILRKNTKKHLNITLKRSCRILTRKCRPSMSRLDGRWRRYESFGDYEPLWDKEEPRKMEDSRISFAT